MNWRVGICASLFALFALFAPTALADDMVELAIGDVALRTPVPAGYVRASEKMPVQFAASAAALPQALRLVEMFVAESDLKPILLGQTPSRPYVQVQSIRDAEQVTFTTAEWTAYQPMLAQQFMGLDLDETSQALQAGMSKRVGEAMGADVEMQYGEIGKPAIYSRRETSMHYTLRIPLSVQVNGLARTLEIECVGAVLSAGGKIVLVNTYLPAATDRTPFSARAMAEDFVARLQDLNPSPAATSGQ